MTRGSPKSSLVFGFFIKWLLGAILLGICIVFAGPKIIRHSRALILPLTTPKVGSVLLDPSHGINLVNQGSLQTKNESLIWNTPYFGVSGSMDWSGYDYLEVTVENTGSQAVSARFEVKDSQTYDYWTRVNLPQVIGPGKQIIKLPTRLKVGEPGRPGRSLDEAKVTSVVLARENEKDLTPIVIRKIELIKTVVTDRHGILSFDVGPEDTALFDDFEALSEKSNYSPDKKWGWMDGKKLWMPYPQVNRLLGPDRLTADNLTIASATLRIDLPAGNYKVWMIIDHPGGFWGEYPYYSHRTVKAQNQIVLDESKTAVQSKADYFKWQDNEDIESEDIFENYWGSILKEKTFEVAVKNDHLELAFENSDCPDKLPCFGLALSGLVVFPINTPEQKNRGENWLKEIHRRRAEEFKSHFQLKSQNLTAILQSSPQGLRIWNLSPNTDLSTATAKDLAPLPAPVAGVANSAPSLYGFKNSKTYFAPVVSWKGKTPEEITWRIENLPPKVTVAGGWIKFRALRDSYTGNLYTVKERWVTQDKKRVFPFESLGRLWLNLSLNGDTPPGQYTPTLVMSPSGGTEIKIPLELKVYKAKLADVDFPVGPFGSNVSENWWNEADLKSRLQDLEAKSMKKLRDLGMTAFSFNPQIHVQLRGDQVLLDTHEVDRVMKNARQLGFLGLVGYNNVFVGENLCAESDPQSSFSGEKSFKLIADALEKKSKEMNWLPLTLILCDEPVGAGVTALMKRLEHLPEHANSKQERRVQWSVTTSLGQHATSENKDLIKKISLPFLSEFSENDIKFPWGFYNNTSRKSLGLEMFHLKQSTDLRYRMMWVWNQNLANPYFAFDGREDDIAWCSSLENADLRCTVELDRVINQGLADYRTAITLKKIILGTNHLSSEEKSKGENLLREADSFEVDPDVWRQKVGEFLDTLPHSGGSKN